MKRIGLSNLHCAYGSTLSSDEKSRILLESYQTFARTLLDIFWFSRDSANRIRKYVDMTEAQKVLQEGKATICVTAHMGNWEILGQAIVVAGYPLASVAAPLINPVVDAYVLRARAAQGQEIIPREGAVRGMLKRLKGGGKVGALMDQNTLPREGGVWVNFYGQPVPVASATAALSLMTGAELVFGFCLPKKDGSYFIRIPSSIPAPLNANARDEATQIELTQAIMGKIEEAIRETPGAWLWAYKRWKYIPQGTDPAPYPFYAKQV